MPIIQFVVWALVAVVATLVLQPAAAAAAADVGVLFFLIRIIYI